MLERGKILIVDDSKFIRDALSRDLVRSGFTCSFAGDGCEAMEVLNEEQFDIVLTDLKMPKMGGLELLGKIKQANIDVVPIVLSGQGQISQAVDAMKDGAFDFIEKPANADTVRKVVARALQHGEIKRHARAMSDLARQWEVMFEASPDMTVVLHPDGRIFRANRALAERLGYSKQDIVGKDCHDILCKGDHSREDCPFLQASSNAGGSVEFLQAAWGGYFELTRSTPENGGDAGGYMYAIRDITDRKRAEDELRDAHTQAQLLIASISSVLICLDTQGRIQQWNATAESSFGIHAVDVRGKEIRKIGMDWWSDVIDDMVKKCMREGNPLRVDDIRFARQDGKDGFLSITMNVMKAAGSGISGVLILGRDITERRLLEAQLTQAQKLEGIGQLAAGIAHEINTPMQYVGDNTRFLREGFSDLAKLIEQYNELLTAASQGAIDPELMLKMQASLDEVDVDYLIQEIPVAIQQSMDGIERVTKIVRAMRDFSHPGVEEKAAIDINAAIESSITVCRNEWKYVADMKTDYDENLPAVQCLPGELNQVILNLIINAAHAIADVVGEGAESKGQITISTREKGQWAEIRMSDTGCGIPEECQVKIFDPFFTTKEVGKGTGQGLAIAHSVITEKHNGKIMFETEAGKGTTFIILLPIGPNQSSKDAIYSDEVQKEMSNV